MVLGKSLRNNFMDLKTSQGYDLSASYHQPGITGEPPVLLSWLTFNSDLIAPKERISALKLI